MSSPNQRDSLLWVVLVVLVIVIFVPVLIMAFSMPMMGIMGWWGRGGPSTGYSPLWGIGSMLLLLAVILGVGYFVYRGFIGSHVFERDQALEELRTAYARGDLTDEEFEQRRQRLRQDEE